MTLKVIRPLHLLHFLPPDLRSSPITEHHAPYVRDFLAACESLGPMNDATKALAALADDLREYAQGCGADYLHGLAVKLRAIAASAPEQAVGYDRELIAQILDLPRAYTNECRQEQARLLRAADNAAAANVRTTHRPADAADGKGVGEDGA